MLEMEGICGDFGGFYRRFAQGQVFLGLAGGLII